LNDGQPKASKRIRPASFGMEISADFRLDSSLAVYDP